MPATRWAFACVTLALVGVRGSVEWNQELFGCGAEAGGVGVPESTEFLSSLLVHVHIRSPDVSPELLPVTVRGWEQLLHLQG